MKARPCAGDIRGMSAAAHHRVVSRGPGLLIAHCSALDDEEHLPATDRLHRLIGPDLTRLWLIAQRREITPWSTEGGRGMCGICETLDKFRARSVASIVQS